MSYMFCRICPRHQLSQAWWKNQFSPKDGFGNYRRIGDELGRDNLHVNAVSVSDVLECVDDNVCVYSNKMPRSILINGKEIGVSACPTEIVRVNNNGREYFLQIFYDEGSNVTLLNKFCSPAVISSRKSDKPIRINSVNGDDSKVRQI